MRFTIHDNGKTTTLDAKNEAEARRNYRLAEYPNSRSLPRNVLVIADADKPAKSSNYRTPGASAILRRLFLDFPSRALEFHVMAQLAARLARPN